MPVATSSNLPSSVGDDNDNVDDVGDVAPQPSRCRLIVDPSHLPSLSLVCPATPSVRDNNNDVGDVAARPPHRVTFIIIKHR
jgi:hypothetical protein